MNASTIEKSALIKAALALCDEAYLGTPDPKAGTWFTDNEPGNGFLGSVEGLSAAEASRPLREGDPLTIASHVEHLRFSLRLANRSLRGEKAYKDVDWARSWDVRRVEEAEWKALLASLRAEYESLREVIETGDPWEDGSTLAGALSLIAHGAWHLGAIRQALGLVRAPKA
jgi:hypothetical protein